MFALLRVLKYKHTGKDVRSLQSHLKKLGYFKGACKGNYLTLTRQAVIDFQLQHIDPQTKKPLDVDGIVGKATARAINEPDGGPQKNNFKPFAGKRTMPSTREAVLNLAKKLHGENIREIPRGSNWGDGVIQFGGRKGWAWCALFLTWLWKKAGVDLTGLKGRAAVRNCWRWAKKYGMDYDADSTNPIAWLPGNALLYLNGNGTGHIRMIAEVVLWPDGRIKECNYYGGNEGHRLKFGHIEIWGIKKDGSYYLKSKKFKGSINPFNDDQNQYRNPTRAKLQRAGSGKNVSTR